MGNLKLSSPVTLQSEGVFFHRFLRSNVAPSEGLTSCGLTSGDRVAVSGQESRFIGLATGYLCEVNRSSVSCTLDRSEQIRMVYKYLKGFILESSAESLCWCFKGICQSSATCCFEWTATEAWASALTSVTSPDLWRTARTGMMVQVQDDSAHDVLVVQKVCF